MFKHLKSPEKVGKKSLLKGKVLLVVVVMLLCISLFAETVYLDVGNDPRKLFVKEVVKMEVPMGYKYRAISRKGSYIGMNYVDNKNKVYKTLICDKDGKKVKEINGIKLIEWLNIESRFIGSKISGDIVIYDIWKGVVKDLKLGRKLIAYIKYNIFRDSIFIIYKGDYYDERMGGSEGHKLYEYDLKSGKIRLIYESDQNRMYPLPVSRDEIVYYYYEWKGYRTYVKAFRVNLRTGKKVKIYDFRSSYGLKYYVLKNKEVRFIFQKDSYVCVGDKNGKINFKVKIRLWDDKDNVASDQIYFDLSELSPNGKILASTSYAFQNDSGETDEPWEDYKYSIADIVAVNSLDDSRAWILSLNAERIDPPYEILKAWSPSGDRIIYVDANDKRYYIMKIGVKR